MTGNLLSIVRQEVQKFWQSSKLRQREIEIELHPNRKCWDERLHNLNAHFKDLDQLFAGCIIAPISSLLTNFAYSNGHIELGNILGSGTIAFTGIIWYYYNKVRKSEFYNPLKK